MEKKKSVFIKRQKKGLKLSYMTMMIIFFLLPGCSGTVTTWQSIAEKAPGHLQESAPEIISAYELHKILTSHFGYVSIKLTDASYSLPDNSILARLERISEIKKIGEGMEVDGWSKDDYAIAAMVPMRNYAFGAMIIPGNGNQRQVMNVLVNSKKEVIYWEPQSCQYYQGQVDKPEFILF